MVQAFIGKLLDRNINLSNPRAKVQWDILINNLYDDKTHFHIQYQDSPHIPEIYLLVYAEKQEIDSPRKLTRMGKSLMGLVEKTKQKDPILNQVAKQYANTTIASNDRFAIDLATDLIKKL